MGRQDRANASHSVRICSRWATMNSDSRINSPVVPIKALSVLLDRREYAARTVTSRHDGHDGPFHRHDGRMLTPWCQQSLLVTLRLWVSSLHTGGYEADRAGECEDDAGGRRSIQE